MYFKIIFLYLPVVFQFFKKVLKSVESYIFISEKINTKKTCLFKNWCKKFSFDRNYQDIIGSSWFMMSWKHDIKLETCGKVLKILTKAVFLQNVQRVSRLWENWRKKYVLRLCWWKTAKWETNMNYNQEK